MSKRRKVRPTALSQRLRNIEAPFSAEISGPTALGQASSFHVHLGQPLQTCVLSNNFTYLSNVLNIRLIRFIKLLLAEFGKYAATILFTHLFEKLLYAF